MGSQDGVLELAGLRRKFGDVVALDGLSFTVPPGQVFGFLGPNGAGKTTAMRAIVGVTSLDGGTVRWNGEPIGQEARRRIGYMPEERGLYPAMRVLEQLEYMARLHGLARTEAQSAARHWADRLGLGGQGQQKTEALSLGNQQRVQLAAAAVIPGLLQGHHSTARVGVVGSQTAALAATAREAGRISGTTVTVVPLPDVATAKAELRSGRVAAVLVGDSEVLIKQTSFNTGAGTLYGALSQVGGLQKLYAQLPRATATQIATHGIALPVHGLSPPGRGLASRITGLTLAILIYVIILTYGIRITIGVGEEKATRVVEVLLTTLRPVQLLAGKVIGMGLLALAQIAAMIGLYLALGHAVGAAQVRGASGSVVLVAGIWLVLGYAFYCTAYAAAGSLISRQSDAYNAALPLQLPLILAYALTYSVIYAPSANAFYHVLAFVPFTAPVAMPVLVSVGDAPAWQVAVSAVISLAATVWMARLAATIYSRAILRTGTRLKVRQLLRSAA